MQMQTTLSRARTLFAALMLAAGLSACAAVERPQAGRAQETAKTAALPQSCRTDCVTPYGEILGVASGDVPTYSNCNAKCVVREPNRVNGTYTGIKWQCVEFARRWLLDNKGAVFGDVDTAADLWEIGFFTRVSDGTQLALLTFLNGSFRAPQVGDLLIYTKEYLNTGHVAVVTDVDLEAGFVEVAEQNFLNQKWPEDYARRIDFVHKDNRYWILDQYLLGWKRM
jgi:glutathionylspermidine amidase/synthetase